MKKVLQSGVVYASKQAFITDLTAEKYFPFVSSKLIGACAIQQFLVTGVHAVCNLDNIRQTIPHKNPVNEYVFFGRSNVGKSSLINSLVQKDFVETSKKPGKTKQLAFLNIRSPQRTMLVDAPGYGYASDASKREILQWGRLIEYYLSNCGEENRHLIMLLIDIKHGFKNTDGMLIKMLESARRKFMVVYTKCDRAKEGEVESAVQVARALQEKTSNMNPYVHFTSSRTGLGIDTLRNQMLYKLAYLQLNESGGKSQL